MTEVSRASAEPRTVPLPYRELERRATLATAGILLALAAVAWVVTVDNARDMASMVQGLADVGNAMPFAMSAVLFMLMWTTMMVAMMFPTVAPVVLLHRLVMRRRGRGGLPSLVFTFGYLSIWSALGIIPLVILQGSREVTAPPEAVARLAGVALLLAGAYQFSRWKETCLRACRSPMTFLATHDFGAGLKSVFRTGASHGLYCAGCCWGLMAVLFVVGLMNLVWMAAIAAVFLAEKNWRHGVGLTRLVGAFVLVLGLAILVQPAVLGTVAGGSNPRGAVGEMNMTGS